MKKRASSNAASRGPAGRRSPSPSRDRQRHGAHPQVPRPRFPAPDERRPYDSPYGNPYDGRETADEAYETYEANDPYGDIYETARRAPHGRTSPGHGRPAGRGAAARGAGGRRPERSGPKRHSRTSGRPPGREPRLAQDREPRPGAGRILLRVLTHNVTIVSVVLIAIVVVAMNLSAGAGAPRGGEDLSANDAAAALDPSKADVENMDPIAAAAVANAKERAHLEQIKAEKEARRLATKRAREAAIARAKEKERKALEAMKNNPTVAQNKAYAKALNAAKGWGRCWGSLEILWTRESTWNERAENPSSGAYGIPQSLPGSKMASIAPDWRTNAATQIKWGLSYIGGRYGDPCKAWAWWTAHHWY